MPRRKKRGPYAKATNGRRRGRRAARMVGHYGAGMGQALSSLKGYVAELMTQRSQLDAQIQAVEQALRVMGAPAPHAVAAPAPRGPRKGGRGRGPRAGSLKELVLKAMTGGGVMSVAAITDGVRAAGYKTKNKTLAKSVGIALTQLPGARKVSRGKFRLK